jgi:transcriptional regulator with XRE-family HTH domain
MARPPNPPKTALGHALRVKRGAVIGPEVAAELGIEAGHYYRLERGKHRPNTDTARKLAAWLGWTVEQLLDAAEAPAPQL